MKNQGTNVGVVGGVGRSNTDLELIRPLATAHPDRLGGAVCRAAAGLRRPTGPGGAHDWLRRWSGARPHLPHLPRGCPPLQASGAIPYFAGR